MTQPALPVAVNDQSINACEQKPLKPVTLDGDARLVFGHFKTPESTSFAQARNARDVRRSVPRTRCRSVRKPYTKFRRDDQRPNPLCGP